MKIHVRKERLAEILFPTAVFLWILCWAYIQAFNVSPDEAMRWQVVHYLIENWNLPHGGDPAIRDPQWGISYAFNPILAYMLMGFVCKIPHLVGKVPAGELFMVARTVNALFGGLTAWFTLQVGKRLFSGKGAGIFFTCLAMLLPGTVFVFSYVNSDGLAILATAAIIYYWTRALEEGWSWKNSLWMGFWISVCLLSYYNAYGVLLASLVLFVGMHLLTEDRPMVWDMIKKGLGLSALVGLLAGWWFIRSYIIYDGDLLGMRTSTLYAEKYAVEALKPDKRFNFADTGLSWLNMLFFVPGDWGHNWAVTVLLSFVGTFGYMTVPMPAYLSFWYVLLFLLSFVGMLTIARYLFAPRLVSVKRREEKRGDTIVYIRELVKGRRLRKEALFNWAMMATGLIPLVLLIYYSYASDFQAQGRYLMPGLLPISYFITLGVNGLLEIFIKKESIREKIYRMLTGLLVLGSLLTYLLVFLPTNRG